MLFHEIPPFPTGLQESPTHVGHALVSSGDFLLHSDSRGSLRISSWSASSPLRFTWYLVDAVSSFGPSPVFVCYVLPKNLGPPFSYYINMPLKCEAFLVEGPIISRFHTFVLHNVFMVRAW